MATMMRAGFGSVSRRTPRKGSYRPISSLAEAAKAWNGRLVVSEEVEHALHAGQPVVALESTIITHGMPWPTNLTTAQSLESILRSSSCTPATIALLDGRVHVGLDKAQLERLADLSSSEVKTKVSRRDMAPVLARRQVGGTTVASTMYIARTVGIDVFVTGGIGGVHRGAENSMDISADLIELGRTPMAVICAGAKSILDIPRTLEVLETQGVCVASYGGNPSFPAFYTADSGCKSPWHVTSATEAAQMIYAGLTLPHPVATLLGVPIPSQHADEGAAVQQAVEQAVRESIEQGIDKRGKEVTPWLLKRVGELTGGTALKLNVALIENNARVGGEIAREIANLRRESESGSQAPHASASSLYVSSSVAAPTAASSPNARDSPCTADLPNPTVMVFGSAAIDITSSSSTTLAPRSTTPGAIHLTPGGVGRNIAEAAHNLLPADAVQLVSLVGSADRENQEDDKAGPSSRADGFGQVLLQEMRTAGMRVDGLSTANGQRTAACSLTLQADGDLVAGVADMGIIETFTPEQVERSIVHCRPKMVVFDCNPKPSVIGQLLDTCSRSNIPTFCDPTSIPKLPRLVEALRPRIPPAISSPRPLTHLSPNLLELEQLYSAFTDRSEAEEERAWAFTNSLDLGADYRAKLEAFGRAKGSEWLVQDGVIRMSLGLLPWVGQLWIKAGSRGVVRVGIDDVPGSGGITHALAGQHRDRHLVIQHCPALSIPSGEIVSTTGAGDTLAGGIVAGLVGQLSQDEWMQRALEGVGRTMRSRRAVG